MSRHTFLGILLAIVVGMAAQPAATHATTITVTTTDDELNSDGDCSLREAIQAANTNAAVDACPAGQSDQPDTIVVPAGTYTLMRAGDDDTNAAGDLDIKDDVTITGAGAATTIIQSCDVEQQVNTCPAGHGITDRVFDIADCHVTMSGVTIRNGRTSQPGPGHGIWVRQNFAGTTPSLTLTDAVVTKNGTTSTAFAITEGGGITVQGATLTATRVTVSDNILGTSGGNGGGIANDGSSLVMTDCTVSGNQTGNLGGGIYNQNHASAIVTSSTISGNHAGASGGGFGSTSQSTATLTNCTVSGNDAHGPYGAGVFVSGGPVNLRSCTITLNHMAASGQGAGGLEALGTNSTNLRNTIIAGNIADNTTPSLHSPDCESGDSGIVSEGHNFVGEGLHCVELVNAANDDQVGTQVAPLDAKLGPLADNGGPTFTHLPAADSLTLDAADPATPGSGGTACPATDQRGETRPKGGACDIGSVELDTGAVPLAIESVKPTSGGNVGTTYTRVFGSGFEQGAVLTLVRDGFSDVVGTATNVRASVITSTLDLTGVAPGVWSVQVRNPDKTVATLPNAYTVVTGGGPDLWSTLVLPHNFVKGFEQTFFLQFGNRGINDARGVPIWISFPDELEFHIPFPVFAPPAQSGQIATDWTRIAIDAPVPPPDSRDSFPLLLPFVPAGSTNVLRLRVKSPLDADPSRLPFRISADIGTPYFQPDLSAPIVDGYVERAKAYATTAYGTTAFPSGATLEQYVRTQLESAVAAGTAQILANPAEEASAYSQTQLLVDTGQFIAGQSATASASFDLRWLAQTVSGVVSGFVGGEAEARLIDPDCDPGDTYCEHDIPGCPDDPKLCTDPPVIKCDHLTKVDDSYIFVPCNPKDNEDRTLRVSLDPNDKIGPGSDNGFIDGLTPLPYAILFENKSTATGDAFIVKVTDQLDTTKYDLDTFRLGPIAFGSTFVPVPPDTQSFSTEVDLRPAVDILVGIEAALDKGTGIVTWTLTTLDPATHQFPDDPEDGFLPPNVHPPEGEGSVLFTVGLKPGFARGTTVCNGATIIFDANAPIDTPQFCNTIGAPEDCGNCVDDDGDGLIDRADPDCAPPANGAGAGVAAAKPVDKCAAAIRKAGGKLVTSRLKGLGACEKAIADCVQLKPGDAACLTKAQAKCGKTRTALPGAEAKLMAAIGKACGAPTVAAADLLAAAGLGFASDTAPCQQRGIATLATAADVTACVLQEDRCEAERLLGATVPRAREFLVLGGFDPDTDLTCLAVGANGRGLGVAAAKQKPIRKCDAAIQKASAKLLAGRTKAGESCDAATFTCVQTKPGDAACLAKAGAKCTKAFAGLTKLDASFAAAVAKGCGGTPLTPADLLASDGLGAGALADACAALGVSNLATVADVSTCLARQISCRADGLLEHATPRLNELLGLGGVTLP